MVVIIRLYQHSSRGNVNDLEEVDIEEMLIIDDDAPVMHSLSDDEIAEMVLNTDNNEDRK